MRIKNIIKTMRKDNYPDDIVEQFEHIAKTCAYAEAPFEFAHRMDLLLTEEQRLSLWERNGGCRLGKRNQAAVAFRADHADKTPAEKLDLLKTVRSLSNFRVNGDGTNRRTSMKKIYRQFPRKRGRYSHRRERLPSLYPEKAETALFRYAYNFWMFRRRRFLQLRNRPRGEAPDEVNFRAAGRERQRRPVLVYI